MVMRGKHLLRHLSTLQTTIALSSAEAEFYALTAGAAYSLGVQSFFRDWGTEVELTCHSDSSSGLGFASRRGLGRIRHVETRYLWLQERVASKHLRVLKVHTDENPADVLTKAFASAKVEKFCKMVGEFTVET